MVILQHNIGCGKTLIGFDVVVFWEMFLSLYFKRHPIESTTSRPEVITFVESPFYVPSSVCDQGIQKDFMAQLPGLCHSYVIWQYLYSI